MKQGWKEKKKEFNKHVRQFQSEATHVNGYNVRIKHNCKQSHDTCNLVFSSYVTIFLLTSCPVPSIFVPSTSTTTIAIAIATDTILSLSLSLLAKKEMT